MATSIIAPTGGDFTSLTAWVASLPGALIEPEIAENHFFPGGHTGQCVIAGIDATANNFIKITVPPRFRHSGVADGSKFYMRVEGRAFDIRVAYVEIEYVQVLESSSEGSYGVFSNGLANKVHDFIVDAQFKGSALGIIMTGNQAESYRNICYNSENRNSPMMSIGSQGKIYNNTVYNVKIGIGTNTSGTAICKNNVVFNDEGSGNQNFKGTWNESLSGYNASNDTDQEGGKPPGVNNIFDIIATDELRNTIPGDENLLLKESATIRKLGFDLGSPYNIGIQGNEVSGLWDIGADQFFLLSQNVSKSTVYPRTFIELLPAKKYFIKNKANT